MAVSLYHHIALILLCRLHKQLGSGAFGRVYRGVWSHTAEKSSELVEEEVAVKTLEEELGQRIKFLQEAAIMAQFKHPYVICLRGIIIDPPVSHHKAEWSEDSQWKANLPCSYIATYFYTQILTSSS